MKEFITVQGRSPEYRSVILITGSAGSGKTQLMNLMVDGLRHRGQEFHYCDNIDLCKLRRDKSARLAFAETVASLQGTIIITSLEPYDSKIIPKKIIDRVIEIGRPLSMKLSHE
jgi:ABC-type lipoprotein export system ATPase subunit